MPQNTSLAKRHSSKTPLIKNTMSKTTRAKIGLPLNSIAPNRISPLNRITIVFLIHPLIKKTSLNASHTHFTDIPHTNIDANIIVKFRIEYKSQPRFFSLHISSHIPSLHIPLSICSQLFPNSPLQPTHEQHSSFPLQFA